MTWEHVLTAVISAIAGGGLGAWLLKWLQMSHDNSAKDKADAYLRQGELIDRLEKQLAVVQAEQTRSMLSERICREELAGMRSDGRWMYSLMVSLHAALKRVAPSVIDDLPPMPDKFLEPKAVSAEQEFAARQARHAAGLLRTEAEDIKSSAGGNPGASK